MRDTTAAVGGRKCCGRSRNQYKNLKRKAAGNACRDGGTNSIRRSIGGDGIWVTTCRGNGRGGGKLEDEPLILKR